MKRIFHTSSFLFLFAWSISPVMAQLSIGELKSDYPNLYKCRYFDEIDTNKDSLAHYVNQLETMKNGLDEYARHYLHYYSALSVISSDSLKFFNNLDLFEKTARVLSNPEAEPLSNIAKARYYKQKEDFPQCMRILEDLTQKLDNSTKLNKARKHNLSAWANSLLSSCNYSLGNYEEALVQAMKAKTLSEATRDTIRLIRALQGISAVYGDLSSVEKELGTKEDRERFKEMAEEYMIKAFDMVSQTEFKRLKCISSYNLAVYYAINGKNEKSNSLLIDVLALSQEIKFVPLLFNAYLVKSDIHMEMEEIDSAAYYTNQALTLASKTNSSYQKIKAGYSLSNLFLEKGQLQSARTEALKSLKIAKDEGFFKRERMGYELLTSIESQAGNYKQALDYNILYESIKDSLLSQESIIKINDLKEKYESELKTQEIKNLRNENDYQLLVLRQKNIIIMVLVLLSLLAAMLIYLYFQRKSIIAERKELDAKQKLLRSQLNPHFLFNVLSSIQQFIYLKKDPEIVADLLAKFSRMTRRILQHTQKNFISLSEEILFLKDYMDLQQIRFDEPFEYSIKVDPDIDPDDVIIPPMFTQAFVENSIEHGILNKREKGRIQIHISKEQEILVVVLEDNGVGREQSEYYKKNSDHRSLATKLTLERLKILEQKFRRKTGLIIQDITNAQNLVTGTKVELHIPYFKE